MAQVLALVWEWVSNWEEVRKAGDPKAEELQALALEPALVREPAQE
jgi:hypothetical protein